MGKGGRARGAGARSLVTPLCRKADRVCVKKPEVDPPGLAGMKTASTLWGPRVACTFGVRTTAFTRLLISSATRRKTASSICPTPHLAWALRLLAPPCPWPAALPDLCSGAQPRRPQVGVCGPRAAVQHVVRRRADSGLQRHPWGQGCRETLYCAHQREEAPGYCPVQPVVDACLDEGRPRGHGCAEPSTDSDCGPGRCPVFAITNTTFVPMRWIPQRDDGAASPPWLGAGCNGARAAQKRGLHGTAELA